MTGVKEALRSSNEQVTKVLYAPVPGLSDMTSYLAQSTGKNMRSLVLLNAATNPENKVHDDAIKAATAIELLHMATLIHDDVMDDADMRRGIPALHQKFGTKNAVICGDYLLSQSMLMIAGINTKRLESLDEHFTLVSYISRALAGICRGEYMQHANSGNLDRSLLRYLKIISGKTAALFSVAAYVGAIIGEESLETAHELRRFGRFMGMAFQIVDDCNDYELTQTQAQKPVGNDIKNGVITLPLVLALRKNPELHIFAKEIIGMQKNVEDLVRSVRSSGGADAARNVAGRYVKWASHTLKSVSPAKREALLDLLKILKISA
jgi:heptaprenyl diphosphate synthase